MRSKKATPLDIAIQNRSDLENIELLIATMNANPDELLASGAIWVISTELPSKRAVWYMSVSGLVWLSSPLPKTISQY